MKQIRKIFIILFICVPLLVSCDSQDVNNKANSFNTVSQNSSLDIKINSPITISNSPINLYNGGKGYLRIRMVKGRYFEDWNPGAFMGPNWEGYYVGELADENGKTLYQTDLTKFYPENYQLSFKNSFTIEFDDYNDDELYDFTLGQYASSNGNDYKIFTLEKTGEIRELPIDKKNSIFISNKNGYYSTKLDKIDNTSFKKEYYDNSKGKYFEDYFKWEGDKFKNTKKQSEYTPKAGSSAMEYTTITTYIKKYYPRRYGGAYIDNEGFINICFVGGDWKEITERYPNKVRIQEVTYTLIQLESIINTLNKKMSDLNILAIELSEKNNKVFVYLKDLDVTQLNKIKELVDSAAIEFKKMEGDIVF